MLRSPGLRNLALPAQTHQVMSMEQPVRKLEGKGNCLLLPVPSSVDLCGKVGGILWLPCSCNLNRGQLHLTNL